MQDTEDVKSQAEAVGLEIVSPETLAISRRRCGRGFLYADDKGRRITDPAILQRIRSLAVPPAYRDVRIAAIENAHLQAIGRDEAGRLQYRYHPDWEHVREERKIERLATLCQALPRVRRRIARDLRQEALCRTKSLAAVVTLIDRTHIRIGGEDYVHSGRSRGAATLLKRNVDCQGDRIVLSFRGKGGKTIRCSLESRVLADAFRQLMTMRGARLFQYRDEAGVRRAVTAAETNQYLNEIAGEPITAKDFRSLAATAAAAEILRELEPAKSRTARRRQIAEVMKRIAESLGNTPAVARKSYVHREIVRAFERERIKRLFDPPRRIPLLTRGERAISVLFDQERS